MICEPKCDSPDVSAIVTAMTDLEQPFLRSTMEAVLSDSGIAQVVLCIEQNNAWIDTMIGCLVKDPRLEIIRIPIVPPGAARNQALNYVKMPWVVYCDGDDVWHKGKTLIQRTYANTRGCDFIGSDHCLIDEEGRVGAFALARYLPMTSSWMVRTEIMRKYPFNESLYQGEDGEWWIRTRSSVNKVRCPKMLLSYRIRSKSLSSSTPSKQRKEKIIALASKPLLREIILSLTWCMWLATRQEKYLWTKAWGQTNHNDEVPSMKGT